MRHCSWIVGWAAFGLLLAAPTVVAQTEHELQELRQDIEALKQGQSAILQQLEAIRQALQQAVRPRQAAGAIEAVELTLNDIDDDPVKGDGAAALMLVEFSDYQCPFCRRHFETTFPRLEQEYLASGKVKYVFRDFPIDSIHPQAFRAAEAANCAGEQDQYWTMHDRLFRSPDALGPEDLGAHAEAAGLDIEAFAACLESGRHGDEIREDMADGRAAGVSGTPTFFLAVAGDQPGTAKTLLRIRGAQPFEVFQRAIEAALAQLARAAEAG